MEFDIDLENRNSQDFWKLVKPLSTKNPEERSKCVSVFYNNCLYVHGGSVKTYEGFNDLWMFDFATSQWTEVKSQDQSPAEVYFHAATVANNSMYIFGGYHDKENRNTNDLYQYSFDSNQWKQIQCSGKIPSQRSGHCMHYHNGRLYVFGGYDGTKRKNDLYSFDIATNEWQEIEPKGTIPLPIMNFASVISGNSLYVFAGHAGHSSNALFRFSFDSQEWSQLDNSNAPEERFGHSMVAHRRQLIAFGGGSKSDKLPNELYSYDLDTNCWSLVKVTGDIPNGRCFHTAVVRGESSDEQVGNKMYIFGGSVVQDGKKTFSNELYEFSFAFVYPKSTLANDLKKILANESLCDVKVNCTTPSTNQSKSSHFLAHKAILASRCGYFSLNLMPNALGKQTGEQTLDVVDVELSPEVFARVLHFLYSDELDTNDNGNPVSYPELYQLLLAAQEYELERLQILVENYICSHLSLDNVIETVKWAVERNWKVVESFCFAFILKHYSQIVLREDFVSLSPQLLVMIMRLQQQATIANANPAPPASPSLSPQFSQSSAAPSGPILSIVPPSTLLEDLNALYTDMDFADFHLILNGKGGPARIPAHRCILAARSVFFHNAFHSGMKENTDREMHIRVGSDTTQEISRDAFDSFMKYLYYDNVEMPIEHSVYCLRLADYYQLSNNKLKIHCIKIIEQNLNPNNMLQVLEAADHIQSSQLRELFLNQVVQNYVAVMDSDNYAQNLEKNLLLLIMKAVAQNLKQ